MRIKPLLLLLLLVLPFTELSGFQAFQKADAFVPIAKYFQRGEAKKLSAWFDERVEIELFGETSFCSKGQAERIMAVFFSNYRPKSFEVIHKSGSATMKYALCNLALTSEALRVTLLVRLGSASPKILKIKIERVQI